jgi:hypothetical protein
VACGPLTGFRHASTIKLPFEATCNQWLCVTKCKGCHETVHTSACATVLQRISIEIPFFGNLFQPAAGLLLG